MSCLWLLSEEPYLTSSSPDTLLNLITLVLENGFEPVAHN